LAKIVLGSSWRELLDTLLNILRMFNNAILLQVHKNIHTEQKFEAYLEVEENIKWKSS